MTLEVENRSAAPFKFEEALHTYFAVSDIRKVTVTGLENCGYLDKTDAMQRKVQGLEPIRITSETDRIFEGTRAPCVLEDASHSRRIRVEKGGSATTVIWNPWVAKSAAMTDFGKEEWRRMLCVETANAGANAHHSEARRPPRHARDDQRGITSVSVRARPCPSTEAAFAQRAHPSIFTAISCARRHNSAARKACSCVIAFSVRFRQSRISCPKNGYPTSPWQRMWCSPL